MPLLSVQPPVPPLVPPAPRAAPGRPRRPGTAHIGPLGGRQVEPGWSGPRSWFDPDLPTPPRGRPALGAAVAGAPAVGAAAVGAPAADTWPGRRSAPIRLPVPPRPVTVSRPGEPVGVPELPGTPPTPVRAAYRWWLVAAALGVVAVGVSVLLAVRYAAEYGSAPSGGATVGSVLTEMLALAATVFVVHRMRAGDDWARTLLAVIGGLVGLLVAITAMTRFSTDTSMVAAFRSVTSAVRLVQVAAVAAAIREMFRPDVGHWFDSAERDG